MKNISELRSQLIEAFEQLKLDPRRVVQAKELANVAGKIINTVRVEMEYSAIRKEVPFIPFVNTPKEITDSATQPKQLESSNENKATQKKQSPAG